MITEKQIEKVAQECVVKALEEVPFRCAADVKVGAELGINWLLGNLWHDASEKPVENKPILYDRVIGDNKVEYATCEYKKYEWNDIVRIYNITHWLYIDDLLKGGAE